jgi:hypothetical protein
LCTPLTSMTTTATAAGRNGAEEGQGALGSTTCNAGVPVSEMSCGVNPGTSVLEGSNVLANWAMDIGGTVREGSGDKAGEVEDILGTITIGGGGGGGGAIKSARGGQQRRSPKPPPPPLLDLQTSLATNVMAWLWLSSLPSSLPLLSPGGGLGWQQPWADVCIQVTQVPQLVLGACHAAIGTTRVWEGLDALPVGRVVARTTLTTLTTSMTTTTKEISKGGSPNC